MLRRWFCFLFVASLAVGSGMTITPRTTPLRLPSMSENADTVLFGSLALFGFVVLFDSGRAAVNLDREPELANFVDSPDEEHAFVNLALALLRGYKRSISPNMGKNCRFIPTCSEYAAIALKQFGPTQGTLLTAWRIARCSPIGGRGYDPPQWPPPAFNAPSSFSDSTPTTIENKEDS